MCLIMETIFKPPGHPKTSFRHHEIPLDTWVISGFICAPPPPQTEINKNKSTVGIFTFVVLGSGCLEVWKVRRQIIRVRWAEFHFFYLVKGNDRKPIKHIFLICSISNSSPILPFVPRNPISHFWENVSKACAGGKTIFIFKYLQVNFLRSLTTLGRSRA